MKIAMILSRMSVRGQVTHFTKIALKAGAGIKGQPRDTSRLALRALQNAALAPYG